METMAAQTTTKREIGILRDMEEPAVQYRPGGSGEKIPHARGGGRTHSRRMIHVTSTERKGRRTI